MFYYRMLLGLKRVNINKKNMKNKIFNIKSSLTVCLPSVSEPLVEWLRPPASRGSEPHRPRIIYTNLNNLLIRLDKNLGYIKVIVKVGTKNNKVKFLSLSRFTYLNVLPPDFPLIIYHLVPEAAGGRKLTTIFLNLSKIL